MENREYNQRTRPMVNFLMTIFSEDINLCARIVNAQAEQNTKILICQLKPINDMLSRWIKELEIINKDNEGNEN